MSAKAEDGLFGALEIELKKAKEPLDCVTLFERASIRAHASSVNRVSDYLGHMWRKGQVLRLPAPKSPNTRSRWLYVWKPRQPVKPPTLSEALAIAESPGTKLFSKPNIEITEEGDCVVITLPNWSITIKKT
jgi:hypothetical protein